MMRATQPLPPLPEWDMAMLFDSNEYVVVFMSTPRGPLYEIVDKNANSEVVLSGEAAEAFNCQRERWNENTPHEEEVHAALEAYMSLGRLPLCVH